MNDTAPPEPAPSIVHENVLGRRIAAALLDIVVLTAVLAVFVVLWGDTESSDSGASFNLSGLPAVLFVVVAIGYYTAFEAALGQTPGKVALSLEVRTVSGESAGIGAIIGRNVLRVIDSLPVLYLVGLIAAAVTKRNQRIGDLATGTVVVRKTKP